MASPDDVTLVRNAVHNPAEPRHFMQVVPAPISHRAVIGDQLIVESDAAIIVKEVGRDVYDHVVYFPRDDVRMSLLSKIAKSTHCPLKGDTEYFDLQLEDGIVAEAAWSYVDMVEGAEALQHLIAFDTTKVTVT